jgi:hypothetical protein
MRRMEAAMGFQRRAWMAERLAWVALGLLVAAGLLGALGRGGWLSEAQAVTADGSLRLRYQRVQRLLTSSSVEVSALARPADGVVDLKLGREVLEGWQIRAVLPPPAASVGGAGTLALRFPAGDAPAPVAILEVEPRRAGLRTITVGAGDGPPTRLRVLVWP